MSSKINVKSQRNLQSCIAFRPRIEKRRANNKMSVISTHVHQKGNANILSIDEALPPQVRRQIHTILITQVDFRT